ncbi:MAG TPA: DUF5723 family protein [Bacteroidales bacterium]|nr:DUF5723 family protein [Bacteroidales bacterium]
MFRKSITALIALAIFSLSVRGQNGQPLYYMNLPQNHLFNPALRPSNNFYLGIGITGINVNVNNNFFNLSDVLIPGATDSLITFLHPDYDINKFLGTLKKSNFLTPGFNLQLFGLGFNAGKDLYISLDIIERVEGNISVPGDLLRLGLGGNEDFVGKTIDLNSLNAGLIWYREASLGFSKLAGEKLRIGARAGILFGMAGLNLDNRSLSLTVNDDYTHTFNANLMANLSGPVEVYFDADNNPDSLCFDEEVLKSASFYLNTRNMGFGLDLGAVYSISRKLSVSAAVTGLGFIKWKDRITNMKAESQFTFSGFSVDDVVNGSKTFDELADEMLDSLKNSFVYEDDNKPFTTMLHPSVILGASYNLTEKFGFGLLSQTIFAGGGMRESLTLSANLNLGNSLSLTAAYTAANHRYDNLGAGLAFRLGMMQIYLITDQIPVYWNRITSEGSSYPLPANWNKLNLRLGINMVLGNNVKKKNDKPMLVIDQQDKIKK